MDKTINSFDNLPDGTDPHLPDWPLAGEVENLEASSVTTTGVNLSSDGASNPEYNFKRIDVTVTWDERNI